MSRTLDISRSVRAPLTFQQQWLSISAERRSPGIFALYLHGALRVELLGKILNELSNRHGSLRTDIILVDGVSEQRVHAPSEVDLQILSFDDASLPQNRQKARRFLERVSYQKINQGTGDRFEVKLLRLSARDHILLVTIPHVVADGFSYCVLFRELWQSYSDFLHGRSPLSCNVPAQYADYAGWQRKMDTDWTGKHQDYWNEALAGAAPLRLPVDTSPESYRRVEGFLKINFDRALSTATRGLARQARVLSPALVMLTVYVALLSAWCGQKDFIVPFVVAGRHLPEHENMIGCFGYFLYLRMRLTGDERFIDLLIKVRNVFNQALKHQDFARMSSRAPEYLRSPSFNWLSGRPDELAGLPSPAVRDQLAGELSIEALTALRPQIPYDPLVEKEAAVSASIMFFDTQEGFSALLCYHSRVAAMDQFAQYLRLWTQRFVQDPTERI